MKKLAALGIGLAAIGLAPTSAGAVTIANGSFEDGAGSGGGFDTLTGSQLSGWSITGSVDRIYTYWQPQDGSYSLDLNGDGQGAIEQTLTGLTSGVTYLVSFFISGNPDNGGSPNPKTATLTLGSTSNPVSYTLTAANTEANMNWLPVSYSFVADGTGNALLKLASNQDNAFGLAVDNFTIAAVPEPALWAMMIFGFGMAGAALRRERKRGASALA